MRKVQDEGTKNHQEVNSEIITAFMPQIIDPTTGNPHKLCPVRSFENYIGKLSKDSNMLWQQPLKNINRRDTWYLSQHYGHNTLDKFMRRISEKINLSQVYTNHCIRVTGVTNLNRSHFTAKQIMSISGHKSLESLAIYQKVTSDEKMMMGMSLTYSLLRPEEITKFTIQQGIQQPIQLPAIAPQNNIQPISVPQQALPAPSFLLQDQQSARISDSKQDEHTEESDN